MLLGGTQLAKQLLLPLFLCPPPEALTMDFQEALRCDHRLQPVRDKFAEEQEIRLGGLLTYVEPFKETGFSPEEYIKQSLLPALQEVRTFCFFFTASPPFFSRPKSPPVAVKRRQELEIVCQ